MCQLHRQADKCAALQINNIIYNDKAIISPQAIKELNWWVSSIQLAYHYLTSHNQAGTFCTKASMLHGLGAEINDWATTGGRWSTTDLSPFTQVNLFLSPSVPIMWYPHLIEAGRHHRHINNMNGSKFSICNSISKEIWRWGTGNIWMGAEHLAGTITCCGW